jgi:hypothetical protein
MIRSIDRQNATGMPRKTGKTRKFSPNYQENRPVCSILRCSYTQKEAKSGAVLAFLATATPGQYDTIGKDAG